MRGGEPTGTLVDVTLAAVLFDMDGTLIDSEKLWDIALRDLGASLGGALSATARAATVGTSGARTMRIIQDDLGLPSIDLEAASLFLGTRMVELYADGVPWQPGAPELVDAVRAVGLPTALVSNTPRPLVDVALRSMGAGRFDVVICGNEVPNTKPHPDPYLAAASALGVEPGACVVIEDSPVGLASGRAAGCRLLAVPNDVQLSADDLAGATLRHSLLEVDVDLLRALAR